MSNLDCACFIVKQNLRQLFPVANSFSKLGDQNASLKHAPSIGHFAFGISGFGGVLLCCTSDSSNDCFWELLMLSCIIHLQHF